MAEPIIK